MASLATIASDASRTATACRQTQQQQCWHAAFRTRGNKEKFLKTQFQLSATYKKHASIMVHHMKTEFESEVDRARDSTFCKISLMINSKRVQHRVQASGDSKPTVAACIQGRKIREKKFGGDKRRRGSRRRPTTQCKAGGQKGRETAV